MVGAPVQRTAFGTASAARSQDEAAFSAREARHGDPRMPGLVFDHLHARATSIYGGSNEIQRGIIAKALLHV